MYLFTQWLQHWFSDHHNITGIPGKTTAVIRCTADIIHESFIEAHANLHGFILCDMWKDNIRMAKPLWKDGQKKVSNLHFEAFVHFLFIFFKLFLFYFCKFLPQINIG